MRVGYAILREVDDQDYFSKRAVKWIRAYGLSDLVLMLIEIGRPYGDVLAQLGHMIEPMLDPVDSGWLGFITSLGDRRGVDQFVSDLEGEGGQP